MKYRRPSSPRILKRAMVAKAMPLDAGIEPAPPAFRPACTDTPVALSLSAFAEGLGKTATQGFQVVVNEVTSNRQPANVWWIHRESNPDFLNAIQVDSLYPMDPDFGAGPRSRTGSSRFSSERTHRLYETCKYWLGRRESNPDLLIQSQASCRWTTPQYNGADGNRTRSTSVTGRRANRHTPAPNQFTFLRVQVSMCKPPHRRSGNESNVKAPMRGSFPARAPCRRSCLAVISSRMIVSQNRHLTPTTSSASWSIAFVINSKCSWMSAKEHLL